MKPSHDSASFKRWHAYASPFRVCFATRRAWSVRSLSGAVPRLLFLTRPPQPRAPLLQRRYPPSLLLRAHAPVLWPLTPFDPWSTGKSLCCSCHPQLVHRTFPALTSSLSERVVPPTPRVCPVLLAVSSRTAAAFAERVAARLPLSNRGTASPPVNVSALQAFRNVTTLSFARPSGRSHRCRRGRDFVDRAFTGIVSSSYAGPATRLNRPTVATDLSSVRHNVLLAAHSCIHNTSPV